MRWSMLAVVTLRGCVLQTDTIVSSCGLAILNSLPDRRCTVRNSGDLTMNWKHRQVMTSLSTVLKTTDLEYVLLVQCG